MKQIRFITMANNPKKQIILFIIGCQRSGTTLLTQVFEWDINAKVFGEFSELSSNDVHKIRLNPLRSVKMTFDKQKALLIVSKPLVETQNILKLLEYFPNSKALWVYRDYKDVAASNIRRFGHRNGIQDLQPIVAGDPTDWRSEYVSQHARNIVNSHYSEDMSPHDAAALFWFVRNTLFFDLNLDRNPRVMMCRYEDLVTNATDELKSIYEYLGLRYPGETCVRRIHANSLGKGRILHLSPEIDMLCSNSLQELTRRYFTNKLQKH